jgi:hypothetical protein
MLAGVMDKKSEPKAVAMSPSEEGEIDALASRLSSTWAQPVPAARGGNQVLQRLAHGRVHAVTVERRRTKRSPH